MALPTFLPRPVTKPILIDPLAFVLALLGAPILVALLGFWLLFIPVFAIYFGGPLYLVLGTPVLLWFIPRYGINIWKLGLLAAGVNVIGSGVIALALFAMESNLGADDFARLYLFFGTPVAFAWGLAFGALYPAFERKIYKTLNPDSNPERKDQ